MTAHITITNAGPNQVRVIDNSDFGPYLLAAGERRSFSVDETVGSGIFIYDMKIDPEDIREPEAVPLPPPAPKKPKRAPKTKPSPK